MNAPRGLIAVAVVLACTLPGFPQKVPKVPLKEGKTFYQVVTTTIQQDMMVQGMEVRQTSASVLQLSWTPIKQRGEAWEVRCKVIGVKQGIAIGDNKIKFGPQDPAFKAMIGAEFTLTINDRMEVAKLDAGQVVNRIGQAPAQLRPILQSICGEVALKELTEPTQVVFPQGLLDKDKLLRRTTATPGGALGTIQLDSTFSKGHAQGDELEIKVDSVVTPKPSSTPPNDLPFKIRKVGFKAGKASGLLKTDARTSRVLQSTRKIEVSATVEIEIDGLETQLEIRQLQETVVTTTNVDPTKK
jgi:hypothetical protein